MAIALDSAILVATILGWFLFGKILLNEIERLKIFS